MSKKKAMFFKQDSVAPPSSDTFDFTIDTSLDTGTIFTLPLISEGSYNFTVDWGDGTTDTITSYNQAEVSHDYGSDVIRDIVCDGNITGWHNNNNANGAMITNISNFGSLIDNVWGRTFYGCVNMTITAEDMYVSNGVISRAFAGCRSITEIKGIGLMDTTGCTNMQYTFDNNLVLTAIDLTSWDVSSVTTLANAFMRNVTINTASYDALLIAWSAQTVQSGVQWEFGGAKFTLGGAAEVARNSLIAQGWTFLDGGGI